LFLDDTWNDSSLYVKDQLIQQFLIKVMSITNKLETLFSSLNYL